MRGPLQEAAVVAILAADCKSTRRLLLQKPSVPAAAALMTAAVADAVEQVRGCSHIVKMPAGTGGAARQAVWWWW